MGNPVAAFDRRLVIAVCVMGCSMLWGSVGAFVAVPGSPLWALMAAWGLVGYLPLELFRRVTTDG